MSTYSLIKEAIQNRTCITCYYNGYLRKLAPHAIGSKNGKNNGLFYQYGGESSSGLSSNPQNNWRCIPIDQIREAILNDDEFATAENHSRSQTCVGTIDVEIDY